MISLAALQKALTGIMPHLPRGLQRLMPGLLPCLPLAFEIAKHLYKHREEISDILGNLTKQTSKQAKRGAQGVAEIAPRLPKKIEPKLKRWAAYLPCAVDIAKASYEKNSEKVRSLTTPLPSKVKKKVDRIVQRHHRPSRLSFLRKR